jgi:hypothetical protein
LLNNWTRTVLIVPRLSTLCAGPKVGYLKYSIINQIEIMSKKIEFTTLRIMLNGDKVKVIKKALKSSEAAGIFHPKESAQVKLILEQLSR